MKYRNVSLHFVIVNLLSLLPSPYKFKHLKERKQHMFLPKTTSFCMAILTFGTSLFGPNFDWIFLLTLTVSSTLVTEDMF